MVNHEINYNSLSNEPNPFQDEEIDADTEDTPRNSGIMIHIVPETSKARWNHIEDLDSFFTRMYDYHQKHGFSVIVLDEIFQLLEFLFVVWLITFTTHCIQYPILFGEIKTNHTKVYLEDVFLPVNECFTNFGLFTVICLIAATFLFFLRLIKVLYHIAQYWDIKKFYNTALKIEDYDLDNISWHEVQKKIREVQSEQQMCIHKEQLTELDIYHRILRFKNYMVALMNKNLLPTRINLPIIGEVVSLSRGLIYNLEFILFRGPWALFENHWQLRGDLAVRSNRMELARKLSNQIMWLAIANLIFSPFVFLYQLTYISFSYATILRKEPGSLGVRTWSRYGRLYLRHFNELDHELDARLNRAYEPADKYMSSFSSPLVTVFSKNLLFICGGLFAVIVGLGIYEEHVFQVEHILTIVTVLSGIGVVCRILIPDENLIWCPEQLITAVLAHVHYLPTSWKGFAHTTMVRREFGNFFQFKAVYLLNELVSPIITPFVLVFVLRPRALDIVDFFRSFTVSVVGVGNVCSFAQMDVRKHGNPDWQICVISENNQEYESFKEIKNARVMNQGEHGKTELSLIHFTLTNPNWKMPPDARLFMKEIKQHALRDLITDASEKKNINSAMEQSLMSFGGIGEEYSSIANSVIQHRNLSVCGLSESINPSKKNINSQSVPGTSYSVNSSHGYDFEQMLHQNLGDGSAIPHRVLHNINEDGNEIDDSPLQCNIENEPTTILLNKRARKKGVRKSEGCTDGPKESLLYSLYTLNPQMAANPPDITTADMCLSTLYLHELHHRQVKKKSVKLAQSQKGLWQKPHEQDITAAGMPEAQSMDVRNLPKIAESTPLLATKRS